VSYFGVAGLLQARVVLVSTGNLVPAGKVDQVPVTINVVVHRFALAHPPRRPALSPLPVHAAR
jgi:hypothetical protein